jgi:3-deoxy-D-manno-octulosonic-acid transferase
MLYTFVIGIVLFLLRLVALFSNKINHFLSVRKNIIPTIQEKISPSDYVLWFHCASLGEFEQARPLIVASKKEYPNYKIALTFFSPSGFEIQKNYPLADVVTYLPLDKPSYLREFLEVLNPDALFLIKYEFWPGLIKEVKNKNILIFSVASIFRSEQLFFKPFGLFMRNILRKIDLFFVQNQDSQDLLNSININNSIIIGDTRNDRVLNILNKDNSNDVIERFVNNKDCFVVGSSWPEDIEILNKVIDSSTNIKTIIAPHNVDEKSLIEIERSFKKPTIRLSRLDELKEIGEEILLIDCIGILTQIYSYADIAYVGGGMGNKGLHNILEPAVFGIPVFVGKNYKRYQEALDLKSKGGLISVRSTEDFKEKFTEISNDKFIQKKMGTLNSEYIKNQAGATLKVITKLKQVLKH